MPDWNAIQAEYEQGSTSLRQLAAKYGVSKTYLIEKRNKEGWTRPDRPPIDRPLTTPQAGTSPIPTHKKGPMTPVQRSAAQAAFLDAYAQQANVMMAAKVAGVHRRTIYEWLEQDEEFSFAYHQAKEDAKDTLRAEIYRRGVEGWEEPLASAGMLVGKVRKYSDTLLIFHSKALMPEYRDKQQIDVSTTPTDVKAMQEAIMQALAQHPDAKQAVAQALMDKAREQR